MNEHIKKTTIRLIILSIVSKYHFLLIFDFTDMSCIFSFIYLDRL